MSVTMLSMNLAGSKKLSEILQARDLAPRTPQLAEGGYTTHRCISPGQSRAGQLGTAQEETKMKMLLNQMEILKKSEINLEDLHFIIFSTQDTAIFPFYVCFLHVCEEMVNSPTESHTAGH